MLESPPFMAGECQEACFDALELFLGGVFLDLGWFVEVPLLLGGRVINSPVHYLPSCIAAYLPSASSSFLAHKASKLPQLNALPKECGRIFTLKYSKLTCNINHTTHQIV
jgi:hypothetical protein